MADRIITVNIDHTTSIDNSYLAIQGEQITVDVIIAIGLRSLGYDGYVDFLLPDGSSYFKGAYDCSSGTISFTLGDVDSILDKDGVVYFQFVLANTTGSVREIMWLSKQYKTEVLQSILAETSAILPYVPQMIFPIQYPAENVSISDIGNLFIATQVETALQEVMQNTNDLQVGQILPYLMENQKVIDLTVPVVASLTSQINYGIAYINNKVVEKQIYPYTFSASCDTYIDLSDTGVYTFLPVANDAAYPALTANSMRLGRVVTDGTQVIAFNTYAENTMIGLWAGMNNAKGWKNTFFGYRAGENNIDGNWNTFIGYYAGQLSTNGGANTMVGYGAGRGNTVGMYNTFLGFETGHLNESGVDNTCLGMHAGEENSIGNRNTFVGKDAGYYNTADNNTTIGYSAGKGLTSGIENTFVGVNAGNGNADANGNTMIGFNAGVSSHGVGNTAVGDYALLNETTGYYNACLGRQAGDAITTGGQNVFIGADAGHGAGQLATADNSIAIGFGAKTTANNQAQIGNSDLTTLNTYGNFKSLNHGAGLILFSPDGTEYKLTVSNAGALVITTSVE